MRWIAVTIALSLAVAGCDGNTTVPPVELAVAPVDTVVSAGDTVQLTVRHPEGFTGDTTAMLRWNSSDPGVASVEGDGQVLALSAGTATIEVTGANVIGRTTVEVRAPVRWEQVGFTPNQTCALDGEGQVYCWANPDHVMQGYRDEGVRFTALSAGCGLSEAGAAFCWDHSATSQSGPGLLTGGKRIESPERFQAIAGGEAGCGITASRSVRCWDYESNSSEAVSGAERIVEIGTGGSHDCGLDDAGRIFCWGETNFGALGNGVREASSRDAVQVEAAPAFQQLSVGPRHSCALTPAGEAYCWGTNTGLQLGRQSCETFTTSSYQQLGFCSRPAPVETSLRFTAIRALRDSTCGLVEAGDVYCWGSDYAGILGPHAPSDLGNCRLPPVYDCTMTPVPLAPGIGFERLTNSSIGALCGLKEDGEALCWGAFLRSGAATGAGYGYPPLFEQPYPLPEPNYPSNES